MTAGSHILSLNQRNVSGNTYLLAINSNISKTWSDKVWQMTLGHGRSWITYISYIYCLFYDKSPFVDIKPQPIWSTNHPVWLKMTTNYYILSVISVSLQLIKISTCQFSDIKKTLCFT